VIRSVYAKWLWDSRRSILGWTLTISVVGCSYAAFWPTMNSAELQELLETYPEAFIEALNYTDIASPEGYLGATVYGLIVGLLMIVFTVAAGTRTIAGEEEAGILDLTLSQPVSRASVALQRVGAVLTAVVVIVALLWLAMLALAGPAQFADIPASRFAAMHLHLALFATLFATLAFAAGAATGRRAWAYVVGAGAALLAYAMSGLLPQLEGLEWVKDYSAFTWLNGSSPLRNGVDLTQVAIMAGLSLLFVVVGTWAFRRRDVAV
jgi:ABC-2 type transport system permease protein